VLPEPPARSVRAATDARPDDVITLGPPPDAGPGEAAPRLPVAALGRGVLMAGCAGVPPAPTVRAILAQLTELGVPWLVAGPAGAGYEPASGQAHPAAVVINPCDPGAVPLTVSPLVPEPGYPLHAHLAMVRALLDVSFRPDELFSMALARALPRVYEAAGWDLVTSRPPVPYAVPDLVHLHAAVIGVIGRAGFGRDTSARLRSQADARFGSLLEGSAGRFLHGGHPADIGGLLRRNAVLATCDIGAAEDRALVCGALLIRVAEHLRLRTAEPPPAASPIAIPHPRAAVAEPAGAPGIRPDPPRYVLVLDEARLILRDHGPGQPATRAAGQFAALLAELGPGGAGTVLAEQRPGLLVPDVARNTAVRIGHRIPPATSGQPWHQPLGTPEVAVTVADETRPPRWSRIPVVPRRPGAAGPGVPPPLSGRRSAACGRQCRESAPCRLAELRDAELLAASAEHAWLRVWTETLLLSFLTDNPPPAVPAPLRRRWRCLGRRSRECLLARVTDQQIGARGAALRASYDPSRLARVVASAAVTRLDRAGSVAVAGPGGGLPRGSGPAGLPVARPGPMWVVPQLRWLHEIERLCPLSGTAPAPTDHAPPLDFDLTGLPDWPGIQVGHRVWALRRHPLSMDLAGNRRLAWMALAGDGGLGPLAADVGQIMPGVDPAQALRHTAALLEASGAAGAGPGWLEVVLSWPRRFVARGAGPAGEPAGGDAADGLPG